MSSSPTRWVNRTGLPVKVYGRGGSITTLEPSSTTARVELDAIERTVVNVLGSEIETIDQHLGRVVDLPDPTEDVGVIVTSAVAGAARTNRDDLWVPHDLIPDDRDAGISCRSLIRLIRSD
ncbi:hypothetical protein GCM10027600_02010 [Nocardioides ginsengisegetis]